MLLENIISSKGYSLADISSMGKKSAKPYGVKKAVSDMAVVSSDFDYTYLKKKENAEGLDRIKNGLEVFFLIMGIFLAVYGWKTKETGNNDFHYR